MNEIFILIGILGGGFFLIIGFYIITNVYSKIYLIPLFLIFAGFFFMAGWGMYFNDKEKMEHKWYCESLLINQNFEEFIEEGCLY